MAENQQIQDPPKKSGLIRETISKVAKVVKEFFRREETMETIKTVGKIILMVVLFLCATIFFAFILVKLLAIAIQGIHVFWLTYADAILTVVGVGGVVYWWISTRKKEEPPQPPPSSALRSRVEQKRLANNQRELATPIIVKVLQSVAGRCGLESPVDDSDIWHKTPFTPIEDDGTPIIHHYDIAKLPSQSGSSNYDTNYTKKVLRSRIYQRFATGRIITISPHFIVYNSHTYPGLIICDVHDNGFSVRLDVMFASPNSNLAYLDERELDNLEAAESDCDFLD